MALVRHSLFIFEDVLFAAMFTQDVKLSQQIFNQLSLSLSLILSRSIFSSWCKTTGAGWTLAQGERAEEQLGLTVLINNRLITGAGASKHRPSLFPPRGLTCTFDAHLSCSISHYVIVMSMTIFLMLLSVVTHTFTSRRLAVWRRPKMHFP